eukprot:CAMPEP_0119259488 /NCGR_PEP_ID=MMETSP1329-20130426/289_1 /TAXON_ID=114041 /ORGANISM="Genus nov. species nov., Strain RCC1024" /LENGTH=205 /DNA_ID=CAMNT_0007258873 /DNA_START=132 /DNA_END=745 /DNA_ORIENTATION=+
MAAAKLLALAACLASLASAVILRPDYTIRVPVPRPAPTVAAPPRLTGTERVKLQRDGAVQRKSRSGREGECLMVVETAQPVEDVWRKLSDVDEWDSFMRGMKSSRVLETRADNARRAHFSVTKLRLPCTLLFQEECDAEHERRALNFQLDPESRKVAVQRCSGRWVVERVNGLTRVSLEACIKATRYVPGVAVDYVAEKALGRAT